LKSLSGTKKEPKGRLCLSNDSNTYTDPEWLETDYYLIISEGKGKVNYSIL